MGHAYPEKISKYINAQLRRGRPVTINALVNDIFADKIRLSTANGLYGDDSVNHRPVISHCVEQMMDMMYSNGEIEPRPTTREQKRIWKEWKHGGVEQWDSGDDGLSGQYGVFDSIQWHPLKRRFSVIRRLET